ncbi:MAG: septum formation protein Maf [Acidobacteria bacterium]|nr:septum formation protein Maf [Acidobacteriota bacterium]
MRLILASASPRRAELLRAAGFTFEAIATDVDERPRPGESPSPYVRRLAAEKSAAALDAIARPFSASADATARLAEAPEEGIPSLSRDESPALRDVVVIGADTAVVVDGEVLAKPSNDQQAAGMLRQLSGRRHEVLTGISVRDSASEVGSVETTAVFFAPLSDADVDWYVASGEGRDKAGGYAIQGLASRFVPRIDGSYSNVVGLPVAALLKLLTKIRP